MSDDFLSKLGAKAENQLSNPTNPFKKNKEPTRSIQVRESIYKQLKLISFRDGIKIVDLAEKLMKDGLKNGDYDIENKK